MSIDEQISDLLFDYCRAWRDRASAMQDKIKAELRTAIKQHVAEAVAKERGELLDLVDDYAKGNVDLKAAIRARAENETQHKETT